MTFAYNGITLFKHTFTKKSHAFLWLPTVLVHVHNNVDTLVFVYASVTNSCTVCGNSCNFLCGSGEAFLSMKNNPDDVTGVISVCAWTWHTDGRKPSLQTGAVRWRDVGIEQTGEV